MILNLKPEKLLNIVLLISCAGVSIPYGFPLFTPFLVIVFFIMFSFQRINIKVNVYYILLYICIFFYFVGVVFNNGIIYERNINDIQNMIGLIFAAIIFGSLKKEELNSLIPLFFKTSVIFSVILSFFSLYKYFLWIRNVKISFIDNKFNVYPIGTSLTSDYNMFAYALTVGLISSIYFFKRAKSGVYQFCYAITTLILFATIFLSGSRRAWVILIFLAIYFLYLIFKKVSEQKKTIVTMIVIVIVSIPVSNILFTKSVETGSFEIYKNRIETLSAEGSAFDPRSERWNYAIDMYLDYPIYKQIFGGGFEYLHVFAEEFAPNLMEDYPHNPLLSSFLYSGLVGSVFLLVLLIYPFCLIVKNYKVYEFEMLLLYIISLAFMLISGNSFFSNTLFLCLSLLLIMRPVNYN